jgi:formamidopyrimidine-DNA glycosylase
MPELPEVEMAARNLRRWAARKRIAAVRPAPGTARLFRPEGPRAAEALAGARFREVRRVGKNLLVTLERRGSRIGFQSHLGMTGKWLRRRAGEPPPRFSRLTIELEGGSRLHYVDLRRFGRFRIVPGARIETLADIRALGPDPLVDGVDPAALQARLCHLKLPIKVALLDQRLLAGVGNIQASEALHRARIDPRRPARALSRAETGKLARGVLASIRFTLAAFEAGGDDDITYVEERRADNPFLVYGRGGARCPRRDGGTITRIVQAGRATFFCPTCQR